MILLDKITNSFKMIEDLFDGMDGWLGEVLSIAAIVFLFNFIIKRLLIRLHRHFKEQDKIWKDSFVSALYKPLSYYVWFFACVETIDLFQFQTIFSSYLEYKHLILGVAASLNIAWFFLRWKNNVIRYMIVKSKKGEIAVEQTKIDVIDKLGTVFIVFITILMLMEITGRSLNTLIAFGGIGGLALAFSSQEIIASFFGGLMVYLTHPFEIGDWVILPERNIEGHVEEIGWYMTRIRTFEKRPIYVPNAIFAKLVVVNPSRMTHRQIKETIGIRYADIDKLKEIIADIKKMLKMMENIDNDMPMSVHFSAFGSYSLDIVLSAYTSAIPNEEYHHVKEELLFEVIDILKKHNAECAYPTTTLDLPRGLKFDAANS